MSARVLYECTSCVAVVLSQVAQSLRASAVSSNPESASALLVVNRTVQQIMDHAKSSGVLDCLCLCSETSGSSLISGSTSLLRAACESCRAIWSLIDVFELISAKGSALFPLNSLWSYSLLKPDIKYHDKKQLRKTDYQEVVEVITKSFLSSKSIQVAIFFVFTNVMRSVSVLGCRVKRLLTSSCPREITVDFLMIVSNLARMDKSFGGAKDPKTKINYEVAYLDSDKSKKANGSSKYATK